MKLIPKPEAAQVIQERAQDRGPFIAWVTSEGSPFHLISKYLMPFETFCYEMYDHKEKLIELAEKIAISYYQALEIGLSSGAEILRVGSNYDSMIENPVFFEEHILPDLHRCSDRIHAAGKYLLSHTDGENKGLLDLYLRSGIDIADSVCPAPMTSLTFKEHREQFDEKILIYGAIPSILFLPSSVSDYDFRKMIDDTLIDIGSGRKIILSIADTAPPDADFDRIRVFIEKVKQFGPVR